MAEVNIRNQTEEYRSGNLCASHDFCDPNQAMIDALEYFGHSWDVDYNELINEAWEIAKSHRFDVEEIEALP